MTARYAVIGYPVEHSLSPVMHNAAFAALGLDAIYEKRAVAPADLATAIATLRASHVHGFNVTVPHKEAILAHLDAVEPTARAIGAVNTVVRDGARLIGCNTDADGLAQSLREAGVSLVGAHVVVLGAGGAARAAIVGLGQAGAASIVIAARREDRARALATELSDAARASDGHAHGDVPMLRGVDMGDGLREALATATLLVQATSATLQGHDGAEAFAESIPLEVMPKHAVVIDLVYKPRITTLMQRANAAGLTTVDGLGMLLHQGAIAFTRWTAQPAPITVMRTALEDALGK